MKKSIVSPILLLSFFMFSTVCFISCGTEEIDASECISCINGTCQDGDCACDAFWTGPTCETVEPPTKIIITSLNTFDVEGESPLGPWDSTAGQEAPDLVYYIYDGFYFDKSSFQGLTPIYRSDVSENWTTETFGVTGINAEFDFGVTRTLTILLADNDGNGSAFDSDFMELAYLDWPIDEDTTPPYTTDQLAAGTLQTPFNIHVTLEYK